MDQGTKHRRALIGEEAAAWVVRIADDACPEEERAAFARWRDADPEHELAYARAQAAWSRLDRIAALRPAPASRSVAPDPDLLAPAAPTPANDGRTSLWKRAVAASVGLALVGSALTFGLGLGADPAYATAIGERRTVVLEDGSRVELNTDSEIRVRYRDGRREVELVRGEAVFDVAADKRPFVVRAADARFTAGESALAVRIRPEGAAIVVEQGSVEAASAAAPSVRIAAGQQALVAPRAAEAALAPPRVAAIDREALARRLAWRQGAIALDGQPLSEAVAEFNRYNARQILIADPEIAALRLGGYFRTSDIPGFIKALRTTFPITAETAPDGTVELRRAG